MELGEVEALRDFHRSEAAGYEDETMPEEVVERCSFIVRHIVRDVVDKLSEHPCYERAEVSILQEGETPDLLSYACRHHLYYMLGPGTNAVTVLK